MMSELDHLVELEKAYLATLKELSFFYSPQPIPAMVIVALDTFNAKIQKSKLIGG